MSTFDLSALRVIDVTITEKVDDFDGHTYLSVTPVFGGIPGGIDRPHAGHSYSLRATKGHRALAARLRAAMLAQAVFYGFEVLVDVNGATYIADTSHIYGRTMNADLRRLGF